ncbi:hypothetical protein DFS34DRAFT_678258 [Phlyctochytrium arcticum]|nr:hypothetical protein DFS34DRAFT_678258 [Phlyctochytrium arcticum]
MPTPCKIALKIIKLITPRSARQRWFEKEVENGWVYDTNLEEEDAEDAETSMSSLGPATTHTPKKQRKSLGNIFRGLFPRKSSRNISTADRPDISPPVDARRLDVWPPTKLHTPSRVATVESAQLASLASTPLLPNPTGPHASKSRSSLDASRPRTNKLSTSPSPPVPHPKIFLAPDEYRIQGNNGDEEIQISLDENRSVPLIAG